MNIVNKSLGQLDNLIPALNLVKFLSGFYRKTKLLIIWKTCPKNVLNFVVKISQR